MKPALPDTALETAPAGLTAEQITIAGLAVQLVPKLELPEDWVHLAMCGKLAPILAEATTGRMRTATQVPDAPLDAFATPFEQVAEEAVKRANILLHAAAGRKRQARLELEREREKHHARRSAASKAQSARIQAVEKAFAGLAQERAKITEEEFLTIAFKGRKVHRPNRLRFLRACQAEVKTPGSPGPGGEYDIAAAVFMIIDLDRFVASNGTRLTRQWKKEK